MVNLSTTSPVKHNDNALVDTILELRTRHAMMDVMMNITYGMFNGMP